MKLKLLAAALLAVALAVSVGGSMAFYTVEQTAHNVITSGDVDIRLLEWADSEKTTPFPQETVSGVMPGEKLTKIVEVMNVGRKAAYVRVRVDKRIRLTGDSEAVPEPELMSAECNSVSWTQRDGYYYYNSALLPGETTEPLFSVVSFDGSMGNAYQKAVASVEVLACATQADNNGSSVFEASGWPTA